jgi:hypothetical protein
MGRLTLKLLSFAQFEREIAGERIRQDRRLQAARAESLARSNRELPRRR